MNKHISTIAYTIINIILIDMFCIIDYFLYHHEDMLLFLFASFIFLFIALRKIKRNENIAKINLLNKYASTYCILSFIYFGYIFICKEEPPEQATILLCVLFAIITLWVCYHLKNDNRE